MATTTVVDIGTTALAPARTSPPRGRARARQRGHADPTGSGELHGYVDALRAETDARVRLQRGVDLLPSLIHGCHHASITAVSGGRLTVRVATDRTAERADRLQGELDEGPSLQAVRTGHSVVAHELSAEGRWARWCAAAVAELAVTAALSVLLVPAPRPLATLNLYSRTASGLSGVDLAHLHALAAPLADALLDLRVRADRLGPAA